MGKTTNMEAVGSSHDMVKGQALNKSFQQSLFFSEGNPDHAFGELSPDLREDLFNYLDRMGLINDEGMLVIPSTHHFFYDAEDLKGVKTIVNLKQLNHVREVRDFLKKVADLLPHESNFVGCFVDNNAQSGFADKYNNLPGELPDRAEVFENGIESRIPFINRMYSFIDFRTNRYLTKRTVSRLLAECGLQVVSMTELNGLTYFCTEKVHPAA